ncbi:MAG: hypothetical protein R3245_03390, partial [Kiloniellales bacterium]|nr:hypothetical protein [Kiloniellales bacterium]
MTVKFAKLFVVFWILFASGPAFSQEAAPGNSAEVSAAELEDLVEILENEPERAKLINQIRGLIEARRVGGQEPPPSESRGFGASFLSALSGHIDKIRE